jgi:2-methylcitrate dehydratase PrpD
METWVTKELADYAVKTRFADYPAEVIDKAKILILDNIGCMLGGCQSALGKAVLSPIVSMGGSQEATIVGTGVKVPTIQAAFVNGTTANALDYDDALLALGHPGSTIIPAALAMAEWRHASGKDVINAILIGYDVGDRIAKAIQPSNERLRNVLGMGTWPALGAVVAAGKILNFDLDRMLNALGVAGATAPLPNTQKWGWDIEERPIHWVKEPTGWPAWTGTTAAILTANGFLGNRYILDGKNGFWIMAGFDQCDYDAMTRGLGTEYDVHNVSIKPYSACRWQHSALDCVRELRAQHDLKAQEIKEVIIHTFEWVKRHEIYGPKEMVDAQFCIPYTVTMVLLGFPPGPAWYTDDNLRSADIYNLSRKVRATVDADIDRAYWEEEKMSARVEIVQQSGKTVEMFAEIPTGDPRNPLSRQQIEDKFRNQAACSLEEEEIEGVIQKINELENVSDVTELMNLFMETERRTRIS